MANRGADEAWIRGPQGEGGGLSIRLKVVPGASRSAVVGVLGDRLKVAVAAPAEGGKANAAVVALLAKALGVGRGEVEVVAGLTQPMKRVAVSGVTRERAIALLLR
ncbi:MAG: DUF167 domain-containing protein [Phycisphaerales bacterium JB063]